MTEDSRRRGNIIAAVQLGLIRPSFAIQQLARLQNEIARRAIEAAREIKLIKGD